MRGLSAQTVHLLKIVVAFRRVVHYVSVQASVWGYTRAGNPLPFEVRWVVALFRFSNGRMGGFMVNAVVASNEWLAATIAADRALLNAGHTIHIFAKNFTPGPGDASVAAFLPEASFPGYSPQSLTNDFAAAGQVKDGEYQSLSSVHVWPTPVSGIDVVYGWWVQDASKVKLSCRFPVPVVMQPGNPPLAVQLAYQKFSRSIL